MPCRICLFAVLALYIFVIGAAPSARGESPIIPAFERFFSEHAEVDEGQRKGKPEHGGQLLLTELNCSACHKSADYLESHAKTGPRLTFAGKRIKSKHLTEFLLDPQSAKPGATMPRILNKLEPSKRIAAAAALTQYLVYAAGEVPQQQLPRFGDGKRGEKLFQMVGCSACHDAPNEKEPLRTSKPLGDLQAKYALPGLSQFLLDPHAVRPAGRMPSLRLTASEARSVAAYLLELPEVATVKVSYYEGDWQKLPDFKQLKPLFVDGVDDIHIKYAKRNDHFALRFEGQLSIVADGEYTFHLKSDDGSRLTIDQEVVVNHDGIHGETSKSGKRTLSKGIHSVVVDVFEQRGGELILAEFEGPGVKRTQLHTAMVSNSDKSKELPSLAFALDAAQVETGRKLYASLGCASCHELKDMGETVAPTFSALTPKAKSITSLNPDRGCLTNNPAGPAVDYSLRESQRDAIRAALAKRKSSAEKNSAASIGHTLASLNCYACHQRGGFGGVEEERNPRFQGSIPEMGDEGRVPPRLDGIGAKLTDQWLTKILAEGATDRPYMLTRMPRFGAANVQHLHGQFVNADKLPAETPKVGKFNIALPDVKKVGRKLVGDKGFSCIKCHTFGRFPATGIQSMDLRLMSKRLRPNWLHQYLRNPQIFRPRTRMPSAWPLEGPSLLDEVLEGDSAQQIESVIAYLSDGVRAKPPSGLELKTLELIPIDEAIIYRNFINGAGPRAIGVGYPEGINQAWDANTQRLALLWQGRFIDASKHWSGRGQGFQGPAGENILQLPQGPTVARLESNEANWPAESDKSLGHRFRGYRLTKDQRPTFLYSIDSAQIEEFLDTENLSGQALAARRFEFDVASGATGVWLRLAVGKSIQASEDEGWYSIDGVWRTRIVSKTKPLIRESQGKHELLVPIEPGSKQSVGQEFAW